MRRSPQERVLETVRAVEPALEFSMRQHPFADAFNPEGTRLCSSICGFAIQVLSVWMKKQGIDNQLVIGQPAEDVSALPGEMRRHVVVETDSAKIDPTYAQFMKLIAPRGSKLPERVYPKSRIAYIPRGLERQLGEAYADFAIEQRKYLRSLAFIGIRGVSIDCSSKLYTPDDSQVAGVLSGIWSANYRPYDMEGEADEFVQLALKDIDDYMVGQHVANSA